MQPRQSGAGDRPLVTWYHGALGQRVELSRATFGNWVAKTANLLVDELGLEPGDRVAVLLPSHWLGPALLAACWRAGVSAVPASPGAPTGPAELLADAGCAACFVHEDLLTEVPEHFPAGAPPLLVVTDDLLGRQRAGAPGAALPFARLAASMPDHFDGEGAAPEAEALLVAEQGGAHAWTRAALAEAASGLCARLGLRDGERVYSGLGLDRVAGVVAGVALPTMVGTGVVLERDPDPRALSKRLEHERVTVALLTPEQAGAVRAGPGLDPGIRLVVEPFTIGSFRHS